MPLRIDCPCGKTISVADALVGKCVRCPACNTLTPVHPLVTPENAPQVVIDEPEETAQPDVDAKMAARRERATARASLIPDEMRLPLILAAAVIVLIYAGTAVKLVAAAGFANNDLHCSPREHSMNATTTMSVEHGERLVVTFTEELLAHIETTAKKRGLELDMDAAIIDRRPIDRGDITVPPIYRGVRRPPMMQAKRIRLGQMKIKATVPVKTWLPFPRPTIKGAAKIEFYASI